MLTKDLTTGYPRSVREKLLGIVQLARAIDKGIATANGTQGEYHYDCPMDQHVFTFLHIDAAKLMDVIKTARSEDDIVAYVEPFLVEKGADEIVAFNDDWLKYSPEPGSGGEKAFYELRNQVAPTRTDVTTWADLLDLDEKRPVPERVHA
jgi:hypothetical protein